nr:hypothetical protein B0A51_03798 [Rachicladosporium sp. CCFEE 5018]
MRVPYATDTASRAASTGSVWTVGGIAVTEGVLSTTDGIGGRVTSGTSAPHYSADFLRKRLPTDDEATHARRLALAMDLRCENTMVSPRPDEAKLSTSSSDPQIEAIKHVTWRDGKWHSPVRPTRTVLTSPKNTTGELFATGGNDNHLFLFNTRKVLRTPPLVLGPVRPARAANPELITTGPIIHILPGEQARSFALNAACKAIAFAPWNPTLLAAGGGSNDRCIHFFSTATGAKLATLDCYAQVTSIVFNANRKELAATFGFAQPEHAIRVAVFGWPGCECKVKVPWWGEERALYAVEWAGADVGAGTKHCKGGNGGLVVATSDASIKFHEVWSKGVGGRLSKGLRAGGGVLDEDLGGPLMGSLR